MSSQLSELEAAQLRVPPPLLETVKTWFGGSAESAMALKLKYVGDSAIAGGGSMTVSSTGIKTGLFMALGSAMVIVSLYVPTPSPETLAYICTFDGAVPKGGVTLSQAEFQTAVQFSVPIPVLVICRTSAGGGGCPKIDSK
jgi:hypothetical protein